MAVPTQASTAIAPSARRRSLESDSQPELEDTYLVALAKQGSPDAYDRIVRRYHGFVRLKASSYFLLGGDSDDLIQEGLSASTRRSATTAPTASRASATSRSSASRARSSPRSRPRRRNKHTPLNQYVSFAQTPAGAGDGGDDARRGPPGPGQRRPGQPGDLHRGAAEPRRLPLERALRAREPGALALPRRPLLRGRSASGSSATRRRSTTPCSASSARSPPTSRGARSSFRAGEAPTRPLGSPRRASAAANPFLGPATRRRVDFARQGNGFNPSAR